MQPLLSLIQMPPRPQMLPTLCGGTMESLSRTQSGCCEIKLQLSIRKGTINLLQHTSPSGKTQHWPIKNPDGSKSRRRASSYHMNLPFSFHSW